MSENLAGNTDAYKEEIIVNLTFSTRSRSKPFTIKLSIKFIDFFNKKRIEKLHAKVNIISPRNTISPITIQKYYKISIYKVKNLNCGV